MKLNHSLIFINKNKNNINIIIIIIIFINESYFWSQSQGCLLIEQVGVLNIDGYYDSLLGLFDKGVEEGFINPSSRTIVVSATTSADLISSLEVTT